MHSGDRTIEGSSKQLLLRVFVDCRSHAEAVSVGAVVRSEVERRFRRPTLASEAVKRYWKIPEWYEVFLVFDVDADTAEADFHAIVDDLSPEVTMNGSSVVWNKRAATSLIVPAIQWANLELIEEP